MKDFCYQVPTRVIFGRDAEHQVGREIRAHGGKRVLLHFGGGSAQRSGLIDRVTASLEEAGLSWVTLSGVQPNPRLSLVYEGVALCRREQVDFILAVGGGSVIDSAKAISLGAANPEHPFWDYALRKAVPTGNLGLGVILTIPAAGSETSDSLVITNEDGGIKRGLSSPLNRPLFAIMNPALAATLPAYQVGAGVSDIMMHTLDRYFTNAEGNEMTDAIAEGLLRTVIRFGPKAVQNPADYEVMSEIMWAGSLSHNGLTGLGRPREFAVHALGHELSGMFDATHGATLAAMWGSYARYSLAFLPARFAHYAEAVFGISSEGRTAEETALCGIHATEEVFRSLGMPTSIPELLGHPLSDEVLHELAVKATFFGGRTVGSFHVMGAEDLYEIYRLANR